MWSSSNSFVVAFFLLASVLTGLLVTNQAAHILLSLHITAPFHGLAATAIIVALATAFYLLGADLAPLMITGSLATFVCLTYNQDDLTRYLTLAAMLFSIGIYGMVVSRNAMELHAFVP